MPDAAPRWYGPALLAIVALAFALRLAGIERVPVWWDEAYTVRFVLHDGPDFWDFAFDARHPPLYFFVMRVWGIAVNWGEFVLRFPAVVMVTAAVPVLAWCGRRLYGWQAGLGAALVTAFLVSLVTYAQEGRMYGQLFALAALTLAPALRIVLDPGRAPAWAWAAFTAAQGALMMTQYFAIVWVVALNLLLLVLLLVQRRPRATWLAWVLANAVSAIPIGIWTVWSLIRLGGLPPNADIPFPLAAFLRLTGVFWITGERDLGNEIPWTWEPALLVAALVVAGAFLAARRPTLWLLALAALVISTGFVLSQVLASYHPRYLITGTIPFLLLAGAAIALPLRPPAWRRAAGLVVLLPLVALLAAGWRVSLEAPKDETRQVARWIQQQTLPGDVILSENLDYTVYYYGPGDGVIVWLDDFDPATQPAELATAVNGEQRAWLISWIGAIQDPGDQWRFLLAQAGPLEEARDYLGYTVHRFRLDRPVTPPRWQPVSLPATGALALTDVAGLDQPATAGVVPVGLRWSRTGPGAVPAAVSVRVRDSDGRVVGQADQPVRGPGALGPGSWPVDQPIGTFLLVPIPPGTAPGTYQVEAVAYGGSAESDPLPLGTVQVEPWDAQDDAWRTVRQAITWPPAVEPPDGLGLLQASLGSDVLGPGASTTLRLLWRAPEDWQPGTPLPDVLLTSGDTVLTRIPAPDNLAARLRPGAVVVDERTIPAPTTLAPVALALDAAGEARPFGQVQVDRNAVTTSLPGPALPPEAQFPGVADLVQWRQLSSSLEIETAWRPTTPFPGDRPLTIFLQALAPDGRVVAQQDGPPAGGRRPTTGWIEGEIVLDQRTMNRTDPGYSGPAELVTGLYDATTGQRVPLADGSTAARLGQITLP